MAELNPLRYRGYYDTETGFYYLQSRYYDPANHRFINADCYTDTGTGFLGFNMFAYCNNAPINGTDPCGTCYHSSDPMDNCHMCKGRPLGEGSTYIDGKLKYETRDDARTLVAMVHSHPFCYGHKPNDFSYRDPLGAAIGDLKVVYNNYMIYKRDIPLYLAVPNGELKVLFLYIDLNNKMGPKTEVVERDQLLPVATTKFYCG